MGKMGIKPYNLALADCIKHQTIGTVSYQGTIPNINGFVAVRDVNWKLHIVSIEDCDDNATDEEISEYRELTRDK